VSTIHRQRFDQSGVAGVIRVVRCACQMLDAQACR